MSIEVPKNTNAILDRLRAGLYDVTFAERSRYKTLYQEITKYASNHDIFISDVYKLLDISDDIDSLFDFHYVCYSARPFEHANAIVNLLYDVVKDTELAATLVLNTVVKNEEFTLSYDNRFIAKFYQLVKMKSDGSLIGPVKIHGISYLPSEIEIIDIYQRLYTGNGNISKLAMFEEKLSSFVVAKIGGEVGYDPDNPDKSGGMSCYERKKDEVEALKISIVKNFIRGRKDVVLTGPIALDWLAEGDALCPKFDRIQVFTSLTVDQLREELNRYLSRLDRKYTINVSDELDLQIPKDFRTKRIIFSIVLKTDFGIKEKPFLEYFTSAEFELIPAFIADDILIANKYVLARFLYIDLWVFKYVFTIGKIDVTSYKQKQQKLLDHIGRCKKLDNIADGTIGNYIDYAISKKELLIGQDQFFVPYYPTDYLKTHDTLRKI